MLQSDEIIIAGFGGQGVLSLGQVLAYAALMDNKETSWMPSYGPEMRGGTANCIVIISDKKISSPILTKFDTGIILNQPSLDKFEKAIKPQGLILYEASTILQVPTRTDVTKISIHAIEEAGKMNKKQVANMIMLGAYLEAKPIVKIESVLKALEKVLPERHHHLIPLNKEAILLGQKLASQQLATV